MKSPTPTFPPRVFVNDRAAIAMDGRATAYYFGPQTVSDIEYLSVEERDHDVRVARADIEAQLHKALDELRHYQEENEVFGRFAEKFDDLSCCYSAEDVCALMQRVIDQRIQEARAEAFEELVGITEAQAEDPGLWFSAETAAEGYVQAHLRELHRIIETKAKAAREGK